MADSFKHSLIATVVTGLISSAMAANTTNTTVVGDPKIYKEPFQRRDVSNWKQYKGGFDPFVSGSNLSDAKVNNEYWLSLASVGLPGYLLAIIFFCLMAVFWLGRLLFVCCNKGWLCPEPRKGVSGARKMCITVFLIIFLCLTVAGCVSIFTGGPKTTDHIKELGDLLSGELDSVKLSVDKLVNLTVDAKAIEPSVDTSKPREVQADLADIQDRTDKIKNKLDELLGKARIVILAGAASFIGIAIILFILGGLFRQRWAMIIGVLIIPILCFLCWFLFGVSATFYYFTHDLCYSLNTYKNDYSLSPLNEILKCPTEASALDNLHSTQDAIIDLASNFNSEINNLNALLPPGCTQLPLLCPVYVSTPGSDGLYPNATCGARVAPSDFNVSYSPFRCSTDIQATCSASCKPLTTSKYAEVANTADVAARMVDFVPTMYDLLQCKFVDDTFEMVRTETCTPLKSSLGIFTKGFIVAGVGYVGLFICYAIGTAALAKAKGKGKDEEGGRNKGRVSPDYHK